MSCQHALATWRLIKDADLGDLAYAKCVECGEISSVIARAPARCPSWAVTHA